MLLFSIWAPTAQIFAQDGTDQQQRAAIIPGQALVQLTLSQQSRPGGLAKQVAATAGKVLNQAMREVGLADYKPLFSDKRHSFEIRFHGRQRRFPDRYFGCRFIIAIEVQTCDLASAAALLCHQEAAKMAGKNEIIFVSALSRSLDHIVASIFFQNGRCV